MAFEDWFVAHARVSSKPHRKITLDDKMSFFQQLATLVSSGTPLLQALEICAEQNQSIEAAASAGTGRLRAWRRAVRSMPPRPAYPNVFQHHWVEVIRTGEITGQMSLVLCELNKQIHDSRETRRKVMGALMYPIILVCVAVLSRQRHAVAGRADLRQNVQGHGRGTARHDPVRRRHVRLPRRLRAVHLGGLVVVVVAVEQVCPDRKRAAAG